MNEAALGTVLLIFDQGSGLTPAVPPWGLQVEVPVEARGVTVRWLARFYNYCRHRLDDPAGDDFSTAALVAGLVGPQTARRGCAFALMTGVDRKPPDVVVVHAWERPFGELVHSLKSRFAHARDTAVWIDVFALLQWPHAPPEQPPSSLVSRATPAAVPGGEASLGSMMIRLNVRPHSSLPGVPPSRPVLFGIYRNTGAGVAVS